MDKHIQETIELIKYNAEISISVSDEILKSGDYFSKHKATAIKARNEDNVRLIAALNKLIKTTK